MVATDQVLDVSDRHLAYNAYDVGGQMKDELIITK
jgi:hypothetical protein